MTSASDMRQMTGLGRAIEDKSFSIIDGEAGEHGYPPSQWEVVRRIIHATADFEFKNLVEFHPKSIQSAVSALKNGCPVLCDVQMILAGLNRERLDSYGCKTHCFISDEDVIQAAKEKNSTRAIEAMRKAWSQGLLAGAIVAVGNAPTALLEVARLVKEEGAKPALILGVPVGFVSAAESKEAVLDLKYSGFAEVPYIVSRGRKGGSTVAVAIIHALLLLSAEEERSS